MARSSLERRSPSYRRLSTPSPSSPVCPYSRFAERLELSSLDIGVLVEEELANGRHFDGGLHVQAGVMTGRNWKALDGAESRNQVRQGLRIARKQVAPDLLLLPVASPEASP